MNLADWIADYGSYLDTHGYAAKTMMRRLTHLSCLQRYVEAVGLTTLEEFVPELGNDFIDYWVRHDPSARKSGGLRRKSRFKPHHHQALQFSLRCFFRWAHATGRLQQDPFPLAPHVRGYYFFPEIADYLHFCKDHRGLADNTWIGIEVIVRYFDEFLHSVPLTDWSQLQIQHIDAFVRQQASHNIGRVQRVHRVMRGLFRYLFSAGHLDRDWASALLSPRQYALARTPRTLAPEQILRLLRDIDRSRRGGKRDFAIILTAASLGVRVGAIAALNLEDLNWVQAVASFPPIKRNDVLPLPLSRPLMTALADYLKNERRAGAPYRNVFLSVRPPFRPLSRQAVTLLILRRMHNAGIRASAHWLRHAFAGEALRSGIAFSTLQELLGHSHFSSTQIYTKIDLARLREVADNDAEDL